MATTGLSLRGERRTDWAPPKECPPGFETLEVHAGRADGGGSALEVAVARWTATGRPTRETLARLHALRVNKRATPVVLLTLQADGTVVAFGPSSGGAPVDPIPTAQAERFFQAVLDEPNAIRARARVAELALALDATAMPGVKNSGLFANHYLRTGVPHRSDWTDACRAANAILTLRDQALIGRLGFATSPAGADALLLTGAGPHPEAIAVLLEEHESFDHSSPRFAVSPVAYGLGKATEQGVPWLILARGSQLRLYPARVDLGVGRKGLAETFFELDLPHLTAENAGYLTLVFSAEALAEGGSTFQIMQASAQYAVALGARLRDKVYEEIIPDLSLAVAEQMMALDHEMDAEGLDAAYQVTLRIFFRLLFQVYAEDRKLLPFGENARYDRNALKTVAQDLTDDPDQPFDAESTSLWDDLTQVWKVIDGGDKAWDVPPYNGGLFAADPETSPFGALISRLQIANDVMGPVLRALLLDVDEDETVGPIDFRSLSVREFGTIYEGLLESSLGRAEVDLTLDDKGTWLPAKKGDEIVAKAGDVYFHNTSGQRKGTGSYFTPSFVVEHLLERALDPALDDHLARVLALLDAGDDAGANEAFFDFRVADLAMGSGHFLTAAIDHVEAKMAAFLAEHGPRLPGVAKELVHLHRAAKDSVGPDAPEPEPSSLLRRQIARRCIYGLDINPIAVELARVSIWIHTFVRGLPMSSLDHNLVCANSLTGIGSIDEALEVLVPGRKTGEITLFDAPIEAALNDARTVLVDVANSAEATRAETKEAAKSVAKARRKAETAKLLFDAAVLRRIGRGDLVAAEGVREIADLAAKPEAQDELVALSPGHMPVLFPEVFLRDNGGFDVLIGNPPWEKLHVEEHQWWAARFPGLRGMSQKDKNVRLARLKDERPDLVDEHRRDVDAAAAARMIIASGPYEGIGAAHIDLFSAFSWRNWQLVAESGIAALVLPRNALAGSSAAKWREKVLERGAFTHASTLVNNAGWVFKGVHPQYSISLVVVTKSAPEQRVALSGPFHNRDEFERGVRHCVEVDAVELREWSSSLSFPLVGDPVSAAIVARMMNQPRFGESLGVKLIPIQGDVNSTQEKRFFDFDLDCPNGDRKVLTGASLYTYNSDYGKPYAYARESELGTHLVEKAGIQVGKKSSALFGWKVESVMDLPYGRARLAFRRTTRATDSRTAIAALMPPEVFLTEQAPYFVSRRGFEREEAFLLGVLNSRSFDWLTRRRVELNLSFQLLSELPVPPCDSAAPLVARAIACSGRIAAKDERFADWAVAVGVPVGSVRTPGEQADLEAELDALVSHLYGLERHHVEHIFETFHRGWDYRLRLEAVLVHYDLIAGE